MAVGTNSEPDTRTLGSLAAVNLPAMRPPDAFHLAAHGSLMALRAVVAQCVDTMDDGQGRARHLYAAEMLSRLAMEHGEDADRFTHLHILKLLADHADQHGDTPTADALIVESLAMLAWLADGGGELAEWAANALATIAPGATPELMSRADEYRKAYLA